MGRVEETNKALAELEKNMTTTLADTSSKEIAVAVTITGIVYANVEIAKSLAQLADDIHSLREKITKWLEEDGEEKEEPKYTCKDCAAYKPMAAIDPNITIHWCELHGCPISYNGLREPCADFVKDGEF